MNDDHSFYSPELVVMILQLYQDGMAIVDISMCLGVTTKIINIILDRVIPYL